MSNVAEIFDLWPSDADIGRDIGISYPTVSAWKQRDSIPAIYWRDLVRAARRRGYMQVTTDLLAELHARRLDEVAGVSLDSAKDEPLFQNEVMAHPSSSSQAVLEDGHFSRFKHLRRSRFASPEEIVDHIRALREEWDRR